MANTNASVKMCRSPAAVAEQTLIRASTTPHDASLGLGQVRYLRAVGSSPRGSAPARSPGTGRVRTALGGASERRRLERDLHDGVQSELVALLVELAVAQQDPKTPRALAWTLAAIDARARAALDSVRSIARGIYPPVLADFGLAVALRAQAARAAVGLRLVGTVPHAAEEAEEAVYFACSEAIQNVVIHAGDAARVVLRLLHNHGSLVVRISDDGQGFEPGWGTVLTLALPWPKSVDRGR